MKKDNMNPCQWKFPKYMRTVNSVPHRGETWHTASHMAETGICRHDEKQINHSPRPETPSSERSNCPYAFSQGGTQQENKGLPLLGWLHHINTKHFSSYNSCLSLERFQIWSTLKNNLSSIKMKSIFFPEYHTQYSPVFLLYSILQLFLRGLPRFMQLPHWVWAGWQWCPQTPDVRDYTESLHRGLQIRGSTLFQNSKQRENDSTNQRCIFRSESDSSNATRPKHLRPVARKGCSECPQHCCKKKGTLLCMGHHH